MIGRGYSRPAARAAVSGAGIDDGATGTATTWSSDKVAYELSADRARLTNLEGRYVDAYWFAAIASGTSGTLAPPEGASVLLDRWPDGVDCLVSEADGAGAPTWRTPLTEAGSPVTGTLGVDGGFALSGAPDRYPVALVYAYRVRLEDFDYAKSLAEITVHPVVDWEDVAGKPTAFPPEAHGHAISTVTGLQAALNAKEPVISAKGSAFNTSFGVGAGTVCEGNDARLLGKLDKRSTPVLGGRGAVIDRDIKTLVNDGNVYGYLKIVLPAWLIGALVTIEVDIYDYLPETGASKLIISGQMYGNSWLKSSAVSIGKLPSARVRFGHDGANYYIAIGETTTLWNYPLASISVLRAALIDVSAVGASDATISFSTANPLAVAADIWAAGEELGSWTPTLAGDVVAGENTYDTTYTGGRYACKGKLVYVECRVKLTAVGVGGNAMAGWLVLKGLPFPLASAPVPNSGHAMCTAALSGLTGIPVGSVPVALFANGSSLAYIQLQSNSAVSLIAVSQCAAGTDVFVSGCYVRA